MRQVLFFIVIFIVILFNAPNRSQTDSKSRPNRHRIDNKTLPNRPQLGSKSHLKRYWFLPFPALSYLFRQFSDPFLPFPHFSELFLTFPTFCDLPLPLERERCRFGIALGVDLGGFGCKNNPKPTPNLHQIDPKSTPNRPEIDLNSLPNRSHRA